MYSIHSSDSLLGFSISSVVSYLKHDRGKAGFSKRICFTDQYYEQLESLVSKSLEDKSEIVVIFTHQHHSPINIGGLIILISLHTSLSGIYQLFFNLSAKQDFFLKEVMLSQTEKLFLFLYYKNWDVGMISSFLGLQVKTVINTKYFLKKKYGIKDDIMFVTLSKVTFIYFNSFS